MGFKCGIVGLPNVGKSTLFNALTEADIESENYPFCTIEPNVGVVPIADDRLDKLSNIVNPKKVLPTVMEFVDIAGLVKGASQGEGLGNQFLANIRETEAMRRLMTMSSRYPLLVCMTKILSSLSHIPWLKHKIYKKVLSVS